VQEKGIDSGIDPHQFELISGQRTAVNGGPIEIGHKSIPRDATGDNGPGKLGPEFAKIN